MTELIFGADYKAGLNTKIDELFRDAALLSRQERIDITQRMTDEYVMETGERPPSTALDRLATLILREEITDATPWKVRNTEYPITSPRQEQDYRNGIATTHIPDTYGADNVDHRVPYRRKRSKREHAHMDRNYKPKEAIE